MIGDLPWVEHVPTRELLGQEGRLGQRDRTRDVGFGSRRERAASHLGERTRGGIDAHLLSMLPSLLDGLQ